MLPRMAYTIPTSKCDIEMAAMGDTVVFICTYSNASGMIRVIFSAHVHTYEMCQLQSQ